MLNTLSCDEYSPPLWFHILTSAMHFLLIVNASSNFIIYCFLGNQFKRVLMKMTKLNNGEVPQSEEIVNQSQNMTQMLPAKHSLKVVVKNELMSDSNTQTTCL